MLLLLVSDCSVRWLTCWGLVAIRLLATAPSLYCNVITVSERLFREMADMLVVGGYQAAGYSTIIVL